MENSKEVQINELRKELVDLLTRIDAVAPIVFEDKDCDCGSCYNFCNLTYDSETDEACIELTMWTDSLPAHKEKPRELGGKSIPYVKMLD